VTQKGRNNVSHLAAGGLAKFLETCWRGAPGCCRRSLALAAAGRSEEGEADPVREDASLHRHAATQEQAALAFAEVEAAIRLLYQRGGQTALTELVAAMGPA